MNLTILGSTGGVGRELTRQALERGHTVTAIARNPDAIDAPVSPRLTRVRGDVHDPASIASAITSEATVLSGLGTSKRAPENTLVIGARAVVAAHPRRIIWLGAMGTGVSAATAGRFTSVLLKVVLGAEYADHIRADTTVAADGGTVLHAGPLSDKPRSPVGRTVRLTGVPRRLFPASISRATVAAMMLDEAENPQFDSSTAVVLAE
jgi:uncharacterized protein